MPPTPKRLPANYQLVYDVVRAQEPGLHAPAGDIFTRAKALKASLGYSTVYRALDRLCQMGLVLELHLPGMNAALYEQARSGHAHFVCRSCGRIEDVDCDVPAEPSTPSCAGATARSRRSSSRSTAAAPPAGSPPRAGEAGRTSANLG